MDDKPDKAALSTREQWKNLWDGIAEDVRADAPPLTPEDTQRVKHTLLQKLFLDPRVELAPSELSVALDPHQHSPETAHVGDIIEDDCPTCGAITENAIVATADGRIVTVRCGICFTDHDYRQESPRAIRKRSKVEDLDTGDHSS